MSCQTCSKRRARISSVQADLANLARKLAKYTAGDPRGARLAAQLPHARAEVASHRRMLAEHLEAEHGDDS